MNRLNRKQFALGAAGAVAAFNIVRAPAKAATFSYKFGTNVPPDDPRSADAVAMWDTVRTETGGQVDVKVFPNSTLGSDTAMLSQIRSGALEFMAISGSILSSVVPAAQIADVPFAFKDVPTALAAFDGALGEYVRGEIEAKGLVCMPHVLDNGFRQITTSTKPIKTVDDFTGLKIRTPPGKLFVDCFQSLGAIPSAIQFSELYTSLQTHVVDGQENAYIIIAGSKFYEVQKYLSVTNHIWDTHWVIGNPDTWKALPANFQAIVMKNMAIYATNQRRDNAALNASLASKLRADGMIFNTADTATFQPRLHDFYARWKAEFGSQAWSLLERYANKLG
jgi:tripartite ATP-independent transporter DctP family solute receptor